MTTTTGMTPQDRPRNSKGFTPQDTRAKRLMNDITKAADELPDDHETVVALYRVAAFAAGKAADTAHRITETAAKEKQSE